MLSTQVLRCSGAGGKQSSRAAYLGCSVQAAGEEDRDVVALREFPVCPNAPPDVTGTPWSTGCTAASASSREIGAVCGFGLWCVVMIDKEEL